MLFVGCLSNILIEYQQPHACLAFGCSMLCYYIHLKCVSFIINSAVDDILIVEVREQKKNRKRNKIKNGYYLY